MLKIEDVKVGDVLECIDLPRFEKSYEPIKGENCFKVKSIIHSNLIVIDGDYHISSGSLKYFKKKEQSQYTFDDLIDVAVQAVKDKVINGANIRLHEIGFMHNKTHYKLMPAFDCKEQIDLIKSLYKETFVIECEEDINRILVRDEVGYSKESMSIARLNNGNEILITRLAEDNAKGVVVYMRNGLYKNYLDFEVLKGATVEQERGRDDRS